MRNFRRSVQNPSCISLHVTNEQISSIQYNRNIYEYIFTHALIKNKIDNNLIDSASGKSFDHRTLSPILLSNVCAVSMTQATER